MARVLVLDVENGLHEAECEALEDFYRELKAEPLDIVSRMVGGKYFDIFCDDEGLFREDIKVSAVDPKTWDPMLVGNLIFANHDDEGRTTSLTDEDMVRITASMAKAVSKSCPEGWLVALVEY